MPRAYNVYDVPKGKARLRPQPTLTADMRRRAAASSFVATAKLRLRLLDYSIREIGSKWFIVSRDGGFVSKHDSSGDAVAALARL